MTQYIRYIIATLVTAIIIFTGHQNRLESRAIDSITQKDTLSVAFGFKRSMFYSKGFSIGFHYELLNQLTKAVNKEINVLPPFSTENYWELLKNNKLDMIVVDLLDSIPPKYSKYILRSSSIEGYALALNKTNKEFLKSINLWLYSYIAEPEYAALKYKYFRSYRITPYLENVTQTRVISPYDNLIKRYSKKIGWDWRLLAAVIYQESRFSMSAHSSRGAVGLMQVKPSTAENYGVTKIFDPESNIKAGSLHLKRLQKMYSKKGIDSTNVIQFTLASYNAGEGRMRDCMRFTKAQGNDPFNWEEVANTIPFMSIPKYYKKANLRHGKFIGKETIEYVDNVLSKYEEYKIVVKY